MDWPKWEGWDHKSHPGLGHYKRVHHCLDEVRALARWLAINSGCVITVVCREYGWEFDKDSLDEPIKRIIKKMRAAEKADAEYRRFEELSVNDIAEHLALNADYYQTYGKEPPTR